MMFRLLAPLFLSLGGCVNVDFEGLREGRFLLQIRDDSSGEAIPDATVRVLNFGQEVARGTTNAAGNVGLSFGAPTVAWSSESVGHDCWVRLRAEKKGYSALDLPLVLHEFVETSNVRLLTRGLALRRAS